MCSIFCILDIATPEESDQLRSVALRCSSMMKHRGPDWSGIWSDDSAILAHQRLAIVDVDNGAQPIRNDAGDQILCVNGEIYNHREIRDQTANSYAYQTGSDCEVILALYQEHGPDFLERLRGMYAFVLYDARQKRYLVARDPFGIIPLYIGRDSQKRLFVSSELKALVEHCESIEEFPPGHFRDSQGKNKPVRYFERDWFDYQAVQDNTTSTTDLRDALDDAVKSHLMSDVPFGVLLSGGLDSSLVAALAQKYSRGRIEDDSQSNAWWPQIHSFAIGLQGSPDLSHAQKVADAIGTIHHTMHFTIQEGIDAIREVIYNIETCDVTTVRASTPMWLMARKIKAMGIKMVLSGEGSDELFGGYLYFHKAPNAREFHEETVRKLSQLHLFDCLRANKSMAAWGVEARVPFLDLPFIDTAMRLNPADKMCSPEKIEKHVLRDAFREDTLPASVLWRQKEQFSDGVGYDWIDQLKVHADRFVSDQQLASVSERFPHNPPGNKEAYLYREIFEELFPHPDAIRCIPGGKSIACSTPAALAWDAEFENAADPSGRAVADVHAQPETPQ